MEQENIPSGITEMLLPDETIVAAVSQSRLKYPINPSVIAATNQRLLVYMPSLAGLRHDVGEFTFRDLKNVVAKKGLIMSGMTIVFNDGRTPLDIPDLEKEDAAAVARTVVQKIREVLQGTGDAVGRVLTQQSNVAIQGSLAQAPAAAPVEDPIQVAKLRFANGLITKEELDVIIEALS